MQLTWRNGLDQAEVAEVVALLDAAAEADGVAPRASTCSMRLRAHRDVAQQIEPVQADVRSEHFVVRNAADELLGYAHLDTADETDGLLVAELAVHPAQRRGGVGTRLVRALLERARPAGGGRGRGHRPVADLVARRAPGALRLAERFGFAARASCGGWGCGSPPPSCRRPRRPTAVSIRAFRPGSDEAAVVAVNHRAFRWHPEQGAMSEADLREKEAEDWFDAAGFILAVDPQDRLLGFHWTKVHPDGGARYTSSAWIRTRR
ncbi:GNAT family N-acetyltransferase [Saccharopolyspora gregorii]|uniref:GNAT family N-acetyltransferase n=1 Tax=Saccharopolyspora gregorii TaxID=33914 RepID=UPI0031E4F042